MTDIVLVGEAWGEEEAKARMPFVGTAGRFLTSLLIDAGLNRPDIYLTNVFNLRPMPAPGSSLRPNDIENLAVDKKVGHGAYDLPPIARGKYLHRDYLPELKRLFEEIEEHDPNLIIAAGNTAAWAFLGDGRITQIRGTVATSAWVRGGGIFHRPYKVLPVFHPAAILRDYSLRHVTVLDLIKARRESTFPELRRPEREIWIEPSLADMNLFYDLYLRDATRIAFDIETAGGQITCIGFAPSPSVALVIPFVDLRNQHGTGSYWPTAAEEIAAWRFVQKVLSNPAEKTAQNGLYDLHWLWRKYGLTINNYQHDTMLYHHAMQPEAPKGLAFLGSVYTNEASWKLMRSKGLVSIKREG